MRRLLAILAASVVVLLPVGAASAAPERCHGVPWSDTAPCLTLTPDRGPTGTRVTITGTMANHRKLWAENFRRPSYFDLIREVHTASGECEIDNPVADGQVHLDRATGQVRGSFVVSNQWSCFQQGQGTPPGLVPGTYRLSVGCHACAVGVFHRTKDTLPFTGPRGTKVTALAGGTALCLGLALLGLSRRRRAAH